jgi:hypothetical protein
VEAIVTTSDHTQLILRLGSKGGAVHYLQNLINHHFQERNLFLTVDGEFGPETDKFVRLFQRLSNLKDDGIVGPRTWDVLDDSKDFQEFTQVPMHTGRVGPVIKPRGIIWHYTAMLESTELPLVTAWQQNRGKGNGATFLVRRNGQIIQLAPITKNSNHAGGSSTGRIYFTGSARDNERTTPWHPNSVCIGVELSNPGRVRRDDRGWRIAYTGADRVPVDESVYKIVSDESLKMFTKSANWGWVEYTQEQRIAAVEIIVACGIAGVRDEPAIVKRKKINGKEYGEVSIGSMRLGHEDLDPSRKSDPGPLWDVNALF